MLACMLYPIFILHSQQTCHSMQDGNAFFLNPRCHQLAVLQLKGREPYPTLSCCELHVCVVFQRFRLPPLVPPVERPARTFNVSLPTFCPEYGSRP